MIIKSLKDIKSKEEARQVAIDYQVWASGRNLSYQEIDEYQNYFTMLGIKFCLISEFKENAII